MAGSGHLSAGYEKILLLKRAGVPPPKDGEAAATTATADAYASNTQSTPPSSRLGASEPRARHDAGVRHYGIPPNLDFNTRSLPAACAGSHEGSADWWKSRRAAYTPPPTRLPPPWYILIRLADANIVTASCLPGELGRLDHVGSVAVLHSLGRWAPARPLRCGLGIFWQCSVI